MSPHDIHIPATGVQATRHLNLNSGLFYLQANERTVSLMSRIAARLAREKAWDQSVFNEEIFFLSHDEYVSPNISVRVMNIYKFLNSKVRSSYAPAKFVRLADMIAVEPRTHDGGSFACVFVSSGLLL